MTGIPIKDVCKDIVLEQTREDFSIVLTDAIFDVWLLIGDSGWNRRGYREAFDAVEDQFYPKEEKPKKDYSVDEHLPFDEYF